ncbi:MAG: hypothetical protein C5B59_10075 [Bacteroidetes bacterium]|nr:MAG: hypothetical protein C5B59_10075 [Bacteroidota bacterium]
MLLSESKSEHITGQFVEPFFIQTDSSGIILGMSENSARLLSDFGPFGRRSDSLLTIFANLSFNDLTFSDDQKIENLPASIDLLLFSPPEKEKWIRWTISAVSPEGYQYDCWQFTGIEIGQKKQLNQDAAIYPIATEKEESLSDSIINSLPGIFYLIDDEGNFLRWNKRFESVSGYSAEEISRMKPVDFFSENDKEYIISRIQKVFTEGISDAEADLLSKSGSSIPHYFTGQFISFDNKPCLIGMGINVNEKKILEKKLLKQEISKQKLVAQAIINVQEKERAEIGLELHDNVNQILSTGKLYLELAKTNERERMNLIDSCSDNIIQAINEIRKISRELVPASIEDLGLQESIHDLVEHINVSKKINVEFYSINWSDDVIGNGQKLTLFRIIQEQVNNVLKHAQARNLIIELEMDEFENCIRLNISDDGVGFDPEKIKSKKSLGFSNIISRTDLFDGEISIVAAPEKGCKLNVQIPIYTNQLNKLYE